MPSQKSKELETARRQCPAFVFSTKTAVETVAPGLKRQLLGFNEEIMAVRAFFEEGAVGELHKHPHSQVAYVVTGRFEVTVGDMTQTLVAGDSFYVAPETMHGAVCKEAGVLIDMFSPMREDFLESGDQSR
jgi:quercetin dioxygenase-like cupin family protein